MNLDTFARRRHGLVTVDGLRALGLSDDQIEHRVRFGQLVPMRRSVLRVAGVPLSYEQSVLAAVLGAGLDAVASHETAAHLWAFRDHEQPETIDLLVVGHQRPRLDGVTGHRTLALDHTDRTVVHHVPVTTAERTLIDTCGSVPFPAFERTADDLLRRRIVTLPRLVAAAERAPVSGRRKSSPVRALLKERVPGFDPGDSAAELDVMRVLRRAGVRPLPRQQFRVKAEGRTYRLDFAWPETRHYLEFDGYEFHGSVSAFHADRARMRALQRLGWTAWPVTARTSAAEIVAIGHAATVHPASPVSATTPGHVTDLWPKAV